MIKFSKQKWNEKIICILSELIVQYPDLSFTELLDKIGIKNNQTSEASYKEILKHI